MTSGSVNDRTTAARYVAVRGGAEAGRDDGVEVPLVHGAEDLEQNHRESHHQRVGDDVGPDRRRDAKGIRDVPRGVGAREGGGAQAGEQAGEGDDAAEQAKRPAQQHVAQ